MKPIPSRIVIIGLLFRGMLFFTTSLGLVLWYIMRISQGELEDIYILYHVFPAILIIINLLAAIGIFQLLSKREILKINHRGISITQKGILVNITEDFTKNEIHSCKYNGFQKFTPHPMANNTIDFTGLGVGEKEVQYIIQDGNLEFNLEHRKINFGRNLPIWEAESIGEYLVHFIGKPIEFIAPHSIPENEISDDDNELIH